jgi:hypothetical protein
MTIIYVCNDAQPFEVIEVYKPQANQVGDSDNIVIVNGRLFSSSFNLFRY